MLCDSFKTINLFILLSFMNSLISLILFYDKSKIFKEFVCFKNSVSAIKFFARYNYFILQKIFIKLRGFLILFYDKSKTYVYFVH